MSLYEGAVKKPIMTSLCFLAVVIFGLFSLSKLPIDLYPDIDTNTIMVMTAGSKCFGYREQRDPSVGECFELSQRFEAHHFPFFGEYVADYAGV